MFIVVFYSSFFISFRILRCNSIFFCLPFFLFFFIVSFFENIFCFFIRRYLYFPKFFVFLSLFFLYFFVRVFRTINKFVFSLFWLTSCSRLLRHKLFGIPSNFFKSLSCHKCNVCADVGVFWFKQLV